MRLLKPLLRSGKGSLGQTKRIEGDGSLPSGTSLLGMSRFAGALVAEVSYIFESSSSPWRFLLRLLQMTTESAATARKRRPPMTTPITGIFELDLDDDSEGVG